METTRPKVLIVGTCDTKAEELRFLAGCVREQGATPVLMDVSVLGDAACTVNIDKHEVAAAAGKSIEQVAGSGDENRAMTLMAAGASRLAKDLHAAGKVDGMLALGGTMGTDLALDVADALPLGVPKYVVSTVAFSPLIPAERLASDLQMILWAGGLYGLNSVCRSSLSQAAGAVVGACRAVQQPPRDRPLIGMTSLGSSCLSYMKALKPALKERGFELAIFHATGMGGRAFESLAEQGAFAAVMDFCTQEVGNHLHGSAVHAGADRLENAGKMGVPQLVAPGCMDLVDLPGWAPLPQKFEGRPIHAHNRLLSSVVLNAQERRENAQMVAGKLAKAKGPVHFILPKAGIEEWDRKGEPLHDAKAMAAFVDEIQQQLASPIGLTMLEGHINDAEFVKTALQVFDLWLAEGVVASP